MKKLVFLLFFISAISAETPPVDISFLVADLKYNEAQGPKICEIQHACISMFKGYDYIYKGEGLIGDNFAKVLAPFGVNLWFVSSDINYLPMKKKFLSHGWHASTTKSALYKNPTFAKIASEKVDNPFNISSYKGIVYTRPSIINNFDEVVQTYPGIVFIDRANRNFWKDKYKMSTLFLHHPALENVRPRWGLYPKVYSKALIDQINAEINSDRLVIKPVGAAEGKGVIVLDKRNLDATLKAIFVHSESLIRSSDRGYSHWYWDKADSFLVEEYVPSDPIQVANFQNRFFNCTMRVVFALIYHEKEVQLHYLGEYWIVPDKSIDDKGSLNEKNKASMVHPHICAIDPVTRKKVKELLAKPLLLMYKRMLNLKESTLDQGIDSAIITGLDREI